ncbi:MAG: shikimate kinase [Phycisphaerae bacterium]|nr:shikimate kinase [Phycisphaerae bacterium]
MNLVLVGPRGSGKTTIGRLLADRLGRAFFDTDDLVAATAGATLREIFARFGEARFRDLESEVIRSLAERDCCVIALGGGALLRPANSEVLRPRATFVWLRAPIGTLVRRVMEDPQSAAQRPPLTSHGPHEEMARIVADREPLYLAVADRIVETGDRSPAEIAGEIEGWWLQSEAGGRG